MPQSQYVQKPYKVLAEQYTGQAPPDALPREGVCVCVTPPITDGAPHVHARDRLYILKIGDWVVQEQWSPHGWMVIPDAEFQDRF